MAGEPTTARRHGLDQVAELGYTAGKALAAGWTGLMCHGEDGELSDASFSVYGERGVEVGGIEKESVGLGLVSLRFSS